MLELALFICHLLISNCILSLWYYGLILTFAFPISSSLSGVISNTLTLFSSFFNSIATLILYLGISSPLSSLLRPFFWQERITLFGVNFISGWLYSTFIFFYWVHTFYCKFVNYHWSFLFNIIGTDLFVINYCLRFIFTFFRIFYGCLEYFLVNCSSSFLYFYDQLLKYFLVW